VSRRAIGLVFGGLTRRRGELPLLGECVSRGERGEQQQQERKTEHMKNDTSVVLLLSFCAVAVLRVLRGSA